MHNFGGKLKAFRQALGETQTSISKKLNISQANYARYESEKNAPPYTFLYNLRTIFNANLDYFFFEDVDDMFLSESAGGNIVSDRNEIYNNELEKLRQENERLKAALIKLATKD